MKRVLSGIQPTSDSFHLGNYLGAVKQWVEFQQGYESYYSIVDLHALTGDIDPSLLRKRTLAAAAQLIAAGIDTEHSALFVQSHLPEHSQLAWLMECTASMGEAGRMTQFKDKSAKGGSDGARVGLFTYPMLMAADILLYQANFVPVGEDQRQHIELTRDLANRFNTRYREVFTIPEPYILKEGAKIYDLQEPTSKMSKSAASNSGVIDILDAPEINAKKIKSAVTDTGREVVFDFANKPGVSNLMTIYSAVTGKSIKEIQDEFAGKGYGDFKGAVSEATVEFLRPIREKALSLIEDETHLLQTLHKGAERAKVTAGATLKNAYAALGLLP